MTEIIQQWGSTFVNQWLDLAWIPIAMVLVHKGQRLKALAFILVCILVMRLQIEIFDSMGLSKGATGLFDWTLIFRGYAVYGVFIALFLVLSYFSPRTRGVIYLAASLSIFFMAFTMSSIVMVI